MLHDSRKSQAPVLCLPMRTAGEGVYQEQLQLHRTGGAPVDESAVDSGYDQGGKRHRMTTEYKIGQDVLGRITGVASYGLFIRLPNRESGLVINAEVCWPGEDMNYRQGQDVAVRVISFRPGLGLSLSIKRARHKECFDKYIKTCGVGFKVRGVVTKKLEYGAFIRLAPGVEGLAHFREMGEGVIESWALGQEVDLVVSSIHHEMMRIGLSDMGVSSSGGGQ